LKHLFDILETYKDQLGILIQVGLFVATVILIRVGWKQAGAADAQARAAEAQVLAANKQAEAAKTQLNLTIKQMYAALSGMDAANRPLIHITSLGVNTVAPPDCNLKCRVTNTGLGPALEMEAFYGDNPSEAAGLFGDYMGVDEKRFVDVSKERVSEEGLTVRYRSIHGSVYETTLNYHCEVGYMESQKLTRNAFQELADITF
jgi:hypothetical protein